MIDITQDAMHAGGAELEAGLQEGAHPVEIAAAVFIAMAIEILGKDTVFALCGEHIGTGAEIELDMEIEEAGGLQ